MTEGLLSMTPGLEDSRGAVGGRGPDGSVEGNLGL